MKISRRYILFSVLVVLGVGLDQLTKWWVSVNLPMNAVQPVIDGFFNLVRVHNRGAAFGLLANWGSAYASLFFVCLTLVIIGVVGYFFTQLSGEATLGTVAYSLVIAGAVGNLIDRLRLGEVIDFLDFYVGRYHWPAFNVADALICCGAALLFIAIWKTEEVPDAPYPG
jgi:signal peptidase II